MVYLVARHHGPVTAVLNQLLLLVTHHHRRYRSSQVATLQTSVAHGTHLPTLCVRPLVTIELIVNHHSHTHVFVQQTHRLQIDHVHVPVAHVAVGFLVKRQIQKVEPILARLVYDLQQHLPAETTQHIPSPSLPIRDVADHQRSAFVLSAPHLVQMNDVRVLAG